MIRWLNLIAIGALVGSAAYAYSIKYETARYSAEIVKLQHAIQREKDAIGMSRADYAWLSRPGRVQQLADRHLDLQNFSIEKIAKFNDLPDRAPKVDAIGRKLEALGLSDVTTPRDDRTGTVRTSTPAAAR